MQIEGLFVELLSHYHSVYGLTGSDHRCYIPVVENGRIEACLTLNNNNSVMKQV